MKQLKVATIAMQCDREPAINRAKMAATVDAIMCASPDTELVVFGEMILGWYSPGEAGGYHYRISETIPGSTTQELGALANRHHIYLSFGISETKDGAIYNAQVLLNPQGEIQAVHRKWNLKPDEKKAGYQAGTTPATITDIKGIKCGMVICFDAANPQTIWTLMRANLDLVILSLADDKDEAWFMAKANARLYDAWVVTANRYGQEHHYWNGHMVITDRMGRLCATSLDQERYMVYELEFPPEKSLVHKIMRNIIVKAPLLGHALKHRKILMSYYR